MKDNFNHIERYRIRFGLLGSDSSYGRNGAFIIPFRGEALTVIASDGMGWDHVSVSTETRCPTWDEMNFIKNLFFKKDETAVQFHPAQKNYINFRKNCLHIWRKQHHKIELPPLRMV